MKIEKKDKEKYKQKSEKYIAGRGKLTPKWVRPPVFDANFLDAGSSIHLTDELRKELYPFDVGVKDEVKFRVLIILRLSCLLAGMTDESKDVVAITEWLRQLLLFSDKLRSQCGIRDWEPIKPI